MIHPFFYPQSLVVVGASATKMNLGQIILLNNQQKNFQGRLYGVGKDSGPLGDIFIYETIAELPETPDVAILITPALTIPSLLEDCGRKGIRHVVIQSGGFSEYSHGDHSLEAEVLSIANRYGIRFIGPNCIGTVNFDINLMMPFAFFRDTYPDGHVAIIAQSGGVGTVYLLALMEHAVRPGKFVSVGNKLQLDEADFLEYFLKDDKTDLITLYLEDFKRGRAFHELAMTAEKPIIVQKTNRSELSARIARSHTTALSTADDVVDACFRQAAVIRAEDETELIDAIKIIRLPPMKGRRVAVLSRSGGHAVITADACAKFGFELVEFPAAFIEKLKTLYHTRVIAHQNPLDLGEIFDYTIFCGILEEALKLDNVDGVLFNHLYSSNFEAASSRTFLAGVGRMVEKYGKPVAIALISDPQEILDISKSQTYPIFTSPILAAHALHVSATYQERRVARMQRGLPETCAVDLDVIRTIHERCRTENRIPLTDEALDICRAAGLATVPGFRIAGAADLPLLPLNYPVAVKLLSRDASHKSDVGGVALGVASPFMVDQAIGGMQSALEQLSAKPVADGFLIQEMAPAGVECFIGGRRDPSFGPVIVCGLGGIFVEIFKDTTIRLAPVTRNEAAEMLKELKAYPILAGTRGRLPADQDAFIETICRVSELLAAAEDISEIDLNPVIVHPAGQGVSIVDARVFFTADQEP